MNTLATGNQATETMPRNYNISRDMAYAGRITVWRRFHGSDQSKKDISDRWNNFCQFAVERGVKKMENISRELVIEYGRKLQSELDAGIRASSSIPKNRVSAVNTVMRLVTNEKWVSVRPGSDCGITARQYIPTESKALPASTHESVQRQIGERLASMMELQRAFGLRFKESCLLNPKISLKEAIKHGRITLRAGTKGGKTRRVPVRPCGIAALERAIKVQDGRSMIPKKMDYAEFRKECYELSAKHGLGGFHSERHYYAQERYAEIVGAPAPIVSGWTKKLRLVNLAVHLGVDLERAIEIDHDARLQISRELGHERAQITRVYTG